MKCFSLDKENHQGNLKRDKKTSFWQVFHRVSSL